MSADHIRASLEATIDHLSEHPDKGRSADKPATAVVEEGLCCRVEGPDGWSLVTDMPKAIGGAATAPTPGWVLRAALASCEATVIAMRAAQEGVLLDTLEVTTESESDSRGLLGIGDGVPAGPLDMRVRVRLAAEGVPSKRLASSWSGPSATPRSATLLGARCRPRLSSSS